MTDSMLSEDRARSALQALGDLLELRGEHSEIVVIGGACMLLSRHSTRVTRDVDVVAEVVDGEIVAISQLSDSFRQAILDVAARFGLPPEWLNAEPAGVAQGGLPFGFFERCTVEGFGGLTVYLAGRRDMIALKVFAATDYWGDPHDKHRADLDLLSPTQGELEWAADWARTHDPSPGFASLLDQLLEALRSGNAE